MDPAHTDGPDLHLRPLAVPDGVQQDNTSIVMSAQPEQCQSSMPLTKNDEVLSWPIMNNRKFVQNGLQQTYNATDNGRKRRKLSQEPALDILQSPSSKVHGEKKLPQHLQPNNDHSARDSIAPDTEEARDTATEEQEAASETPSAKPQPRRRGRPPKAAANGTQSKLCSPKMAEQEEAMDLESPRTPRSKRKPKQATMKISLGGQLHKPLEETQHGGLPKSNTDISKPASHGKNLTLKNGRLARRLVVKLKYPPLTEGHPSVGKKIEQILTEKLRVSEKKEVPCLPASVADLGKTSSKSTHPFFLGKKSHQPASDATPVVTPSEDAHQTESSKPVAWKDLVFKTNRSATSGTQPTGKPYWPPIEFHHVGAPSRISLPLQDPLYHLGKHKAKQCVETVDQDEGALSTQPLETYKAVASVADLKRPQKLRAIASDVLDQVLPETQHYKMIKALSTMRTKSLTCSSAFDRAEPPGPSPWTQSHSPSAWDEVLQPNCGKLYEWLSKLAVHNVKQGLDTKQSKQAPKRRKRPKKRDDEFGDFIDFDEDISEKNKMKNAILIVGPSGCGKTASVYTVAKQLGFEVFEIHSGMRRSQKDIFDKVGDMTQNHMVRGGQVISRESSVLATDDLPSSQEEVAQSSVTSFFVPPGKKKLLNDSRAATPQANKHEQKQSLILFEEVDNIFEDDRGFWSGVQALIRNSKRPVVMTCNDTSNIPLDELDLYATLVYDALPVDIVTEYLYYMALAEGHVIQPGAIRTLYQTRGYDLRAATTELDFWCQMAVGSTQGGLDWFPSLSKRAMNEADHVRTFSKDTFHTGLDLLPASCHDLEIDLQLVSESLNMSCDELLGDLADVDANSKAIAGTFLQKLEYMQTKSDAEFMDQRLRPLLYAVAASCTGQGSGIVNRMKVSTAKSRRDSQQASETVAFDCLNALAIENSINSLGNGRLAPSLDEPRSILACDIAPYVRSIASYDERLEQHRDELFSSQGKKTRTTRAARAAAEGGDKASTRRERWFSQKVDLQAVLRTGNNWPQWSHDELRDSAMETPPMSEDLSMPVDMSE